MTETIKEYAEALFLLAEENKRIAEYSESLAEIGSLLAENPEYVDFLSSPALPLSERLAAIDEAFADSLPEYVLSFVKLLCEHGGIGGYAGCLKEYKQLYEQWKHVSTAYVTSAVELSEEEKSRLQEKLEKSSGNAVKLECAVDPSLMAGIVVSMDGKVMDGSLKRRLRGVKEVMDK